METEIITTLITSIVGTILAFFKAFKFIQEGERGIKLRFGKAVRDNQGNPKVIEPGFVLLIPFVETLQRHHVRQQTYRFPSQRITLKDGLIFNVSAMALFRVYDIYKALFEIEDLDNSVDDICMAALRDELRMITHSELQENSEKISENLLARIKQRGAEWGVEFAQFSLTDSAPTAETANLINAEIAVRYRLNALKKELDKDGTPLNSLNPVLAAVLVGIPMVASVGETSTTLVKSREKENED